MRRHFCDSNHKQRLWASTFITLEVAKMASGTDSSVCYQTRCRVPTRIVIRRAYPGCRWLLADNASSQTWVFALRAVDRLGKSRAGALWAREAPTHFTSFTKLAAQPLFVSIPHFSFHPLSRLRFWNLLSATWVLDLICIDVDGTLVGSSGSKSH